MLSNSIFKEKKNHLTKNRKCQTCRWENYVWALESDGPGWNLALPLAAIMTLG